MTLNSILLPLLPQGRDDRHVPSCPVPSVQGMESLNLESSGWAVCRLIYAPSLRKADLTLSQRRPEETAYFKVKERGGLRRSQPWAGGVDHWQIT